MRLFSTFPRKKALALLAPIVCFLGVLGPGAGAAHATPSQSAINIALLPRFGATAGTPSNSNTNAVTAEVSNYARSAQIRVDVYNAATRDGFSATGATDVTGHFIRSISIPVSEFQYCGYWCGFTASLDVSVYVFPTSTTAAYSSPSEVVQLQRAWSTGEICFCDYRTGRAIYVQGQGWTPFANLRVDVHSPATGLTYYYWVSADPNGNFSLGGIQPPGSWTGLTFDTYQYSAPQYYAPAVGMTQGPE